MTDAVPTAAIQDNAITTAKIPDDAVTTAKIEDDAVTSAKVSGLVKGDVGLSNVDNTTDALKPVSTATTTALGLKADTTAVAAVALVKPHIRTGVLQPAVAGKLLNGATHSGAYGTAQTQSGGDGHSYYYTDIKGSKPIKDPRIGAHFGSQRHTISSIQKLEQETATHGKDVYSVDGREWLRIVNNVTDAIRPWNDAHGSSLYLDNITNASDTFIEIVGYFNDINFSVRATANRVDDIDAYVNGGSATAVNDIGGRTTISTPLQSRYVRAGSSINIGSTVSTTLGTTPKINTLKIVYTNTSGEFLHLFNIELITQDTTSPTTKSQIQIPAQTVVSYGKKFALSAAAHHYNPFAYAADGTTAVAIGNTTSHGKVADGWYYDAVSYTHLTLPTKA